MAMQNVGQHYFLQLWGGGRCGTDWPRKMVGIAMLWEFDESDRFLTASSDPFINHTLKLFFTIYWKKDTKDGF
jgi:hypothetical protein